MIFGIGEQPKKTKKRNLRKASVEKKPAPSPVEKKVEEKESAGPADLEKVRRELAELRQKRITGSLADGSLIRKKRKEIARILTDVKTNAKKTT